MAAPRPRGVRSCMDRSLRHPPPLRRPLPAADPSRPPPSAPAPAGPTSASASSSPSPPASALAPVEPLLARIRQIRFRDGLACPRCGSRHVQRWGRFSGRQRYRCRGPCGRTFSDLTGTPAAYIKKLDHWLAYAAGMLPGESLRAAAHRLHIHPSTAFRWRHRLLQGLRAADHESLVGRVELATRRILRSRKGERPDPSAPPWPRPPRRRGIPYLWPSELVAGILLACDRQGHVVAGVLDAPLARLDELQRLLGGRLRGAPPGQPPVVLAPQGPLGTQAHFARSQNALYRDTRGGDPDLHVRTATAWGVRFHRWMRRFRGVATRYLPRYLVWHRWVDRSRSHPSLDPLFHWPLAPDGG